MTASYNVWFRTVCFLKMPNALCKIYVLGAVPTICELARLGGMKWNPSYFNQKIFGISLEKVCFYQVVLWRFYVLWQFYIFYNKQWCKAVINKKRQKFGSFMENKCSYIV